MSIDFDKKEERKKYLDTKLDDLLDGINDTYGKALINELLSRLENTIKDFDNEVHSLLNTLKANSDKREILLEQIKHSQIDNSDSKASDSKQELSEWERHLESIEH